MKHLIHRYFPRVIFIKDKLIALGDSLTPCLSSYSQEGEDTICWKILKKYDLGNGVYMDIGANHPSKISNTYFMYRQGLNGITIEPDSRLVKLHMSTRPRDISLCIGCGEKSGLFPLRVSKSSVFNSFSAESMKFDEMEVRYVTVLPVDLIVESLITDKWIFLMSIDVEGWDLQVLKSARHSLEKTFLVIVETDGGNSETDSYLIECGFLIIHKTTYNSIYRNQKSFEHYKK